MNVFIMQNQKNTRQCYVTSSYSVIGLALSGFGSSKGTFVQCIHKFTWVVAPRLVCIKIDKKTGDPITADQGTLNMYERVELYTLHDNGGVVFVGPSTQIYLCPFISRKRGIFN